MIALNPKYNGLPEKKTQKISRNNQPPEKVESKLTLKTVLDKTRGEIQNLNAYDPSLYDEFTSTLITTLYSDLDDEAKMSEIAKIGEKVRSILNSY